MPSSVASPKAADEKTNVVTGTSTDKPNASTKWVPESSGSNGCDAPSAMPTVTPSRPRRPRLIEPAAGGQAADQQPVHGHERAPGIVNGTSPVPAGRRRIRQRWRTDRVGHCWPTR